MNISVFGLGYVGVVTAACFAKEGHQVLGVDISEDKVAQLNAGRSPIVEDAIGELIADARASGLLLATTDAGSAVASSDLIIVCVGTPSASNGSLDTSHVAAVCRQIGTLLKTAAHRPTLVIRSTMLPGSMRKLVVPALMEVAGDNLGNLCTVVFHPEFLREGSSVRDFYDPPKIVIGEENPGDGDQLMMLYTGFTAPVFRAPYEVAEMVKYCDNMFHALKITFANEIGLFCAGLGIDSHQVMEIFCSDTKLNISKSYLRPGFAFGGSCLPKDMRAFLHSARQRDVETPMLAGILPSNKGQIERAAQIIFKTGARKVGLWGLAFKPGTDDLRESPLVTLAELLCGKGVDLGIHDEFVQVARLVGGNKAFIEQVLPHLARLLVQSPEDLNACELIIVGHPAPAGKVPEWLAEGKTIVDLCGLRPTPKHPAYIAIV